jgi:hypothetical protein
MSDLELMRLYLLYKAGSVQDGRKNSDLLKIAKATANDLTEEEFIWLHNEIERLGNIQQSRSREKRNTVGIDRVGEKEWSVWQSAKNFAMGSGEYQKRLWELPDLVRSDKPFTPTRLADGNPIDLDPNDPEGSQERLRSQPYSQVKHDPKLRDAWHAAQSGKFADMLRGNNETEGWDVLLQGSAPSPVTSAPLRKLLESFNGEDQLQPPIVGVPNVDAGGNVIPPPINIGQVARKNAANDAQGIIDDPLSASSGKGGFFAKGLDAIQAGMDVAGAIDPTPIVDGVNAGVSVVRAFTDPKNAGKHLVNAGVSAVSMVPYLGDLAKVFKYGGRAAKAGEAGKAAEAAEAGGGGIGGTIGSILGSLGGSGGSGGGGDGNSSSDSGDGSSWKVFGGVAAGAIGLVAAFKALGSWINRTVASGEALLDSQRDLAKYSGELSNAFAQYDTRDVLRNVRNAEYLGSSAAGLAGSQSDLKDAVAFRDAPQRRFNNDFGNVMAQVATWGVYLQSFTDAKGLILRALYKIVDNTKPSKDTEENNVIGELAKEIEKEKAGANNPPKREPPRLPADGIPKGLQDRINRLNIR